MPGTEKAAFLPQREHHWVRAPDRPPTIAGREKFARSHSQELGLSVHRDDITHHDQQGARP